MLNILKEMERCRKQKKRGVLATIIRIDGSSYQKEGAKCFYSEDGRLTGLLSGGCVESDVIEHAKMVLETGIPKKVTYDFRDQNDDLWGLGVGCNGSIEIFLETFDPIKLPSLSKMMEINHISINNDIVATITASNNQSTVGEKWLVSSKNDSVSIAGCVIHLKQNIAIQKRKSTLVKLNGNEIFFDFINPIPELIIFGAGPDAVPLINGVKNLGWKVKVADHRPGFLTQENFHNADGLIHYSKGLVPDIQLNDTTFTVIMSHNFSQDQLVLELLLKSNVPYIGVLGPSRRTKRLLEPILQKYQEKYLGLTRINSPVGIDIGAKTPEEIALSISAELVNVLRGGNSIHLKETKGEDLIANRGNEESRCSILI